MEEKLAQVAIAIDGERNPSFSRVQIYAKDILMGAEALIEAKLPVIVIVESDMAKVLGQTMYHLLEWNKEVICLDSIHLSEGDYIDIGRPIAEGCVLPVVVKTLVFKTQ